MTYKSVSKKLDFLNRATLNAMAEESNSLIIRNFTEECIEIFGADFGFAFGRFNIKDKYSLVYKSSNTPYDPVIPVKVKNTSMPGKRGDYLHDNNVNKENYNSGIDKFLKSYIIIPVHYGDHAYGSIVICFKQRHNFTRPELSLSATIGNVIAQAITVNWLVESKAKERILAEKQKATEVFLSQEKIKNEFIANATHEIRTPLAIIKGNIDLARRLGKKDIKLSEDIIEAIDEEIVRLSDIVSDLALLTSQGGRGQTDAVIYNKVNIKSLVNSVVERCSTIASPKNISLTVKNIPNIKIYGNADYLEKMLMNLIKNSITYGHQNGRTTIYAKVSKGSVKISVEDNGIGVSKEDINHVFERFYRGDESHNSDGNRTGLGLAIVKWVAEIHGGGVDVKSAPQKGSIFSVTLPLKRK